MSQLVQDALSGKRRAMARLISIVEEGNARGREAIAQIYPHTGRAHVIGVTGPSGSGKSTLVAQMALEYRLRDLTVGIVAVDPTSPFSGGALLGDRVRMRALSGDPCIYLRSMASRGSTGGLARGTADVVKVLDACKYQRIFIETVGAGQIELDVARTAHTVIVVQVPGMGDEIQTLKAGILEIADILAVNKADHQGADRTVATLEAMLELAVDQKWRPPVVKTIATSGVGTAEMVDIVEQHVAYLHESGEIRQQARARLVRELQDILREELYHRWLAHVGQDRIKETADRLVARRTDPYTAAHELLMRAEE
jgi:LAO/AO transport system kinase